ncbi:hypothetical protein EON65_42120 [archaeon]|nr:MAG: hypothetical protein EON65_42120 [archaeon]
MHLAANLGHLHIVNFLLEKRCSIYKTDKVYG